jgi:hypothetical protein
MFRAALPCPNANSQKEFCELGTVNLSEVEVRMFKNIQSLIRSRSPKKILIAFAAAFVATVLMVLVPNASANAGTFVYGSRTSSVANLGSTSGGSLQNEVNCNNGKFVSAIRLKHNGGDFISQMRFWCKPQVANSATTTATGEDQIDILWSGDNTGIQDVGCGSDSYVSGLRAVYSGWLDDLGVVCKNILTQAVTNVEPKFNQGSVTQTFNCPTGEFVVGFRARTGSLVDGIQYVQCQRLQYQLATPTISSVTDNGASLTVALGNQDAMPNTNYQVKIYDAGSNALLATSAFFTTSSVTVTDANLYCGRAYSVTAQATGINGGNGTFEIQSPVVSTSKAADSGCNPSSLTISTGADSNARWNATAGTFDAITKNAAMVLNNETLRARLQTGTSGTNVTINPSDWVNTTGAVTASANACGNLTINSGANVGLSAAINLASCTNTGSAIKVTALGYIYQNAAFTTNIGAVTYLSNSDNGSGASAGPIYITAASTINTNGGAVILAGGSTTATTGYARGYATPFSGGTALLDGSPVIDNAGIYLAGEINSGSGAITLNGQIGSGTADSAGVYLVADSAIRTSGALTLKGFIGTDQTDTGRSHRAVRVGNGGTSPLPTIAATGSGSVSITAITSSTNTAMNL